MARSYESIAQGLQEAIDLNAAKAHWTCGDDVVAKELQAV